ncbi:MAG: DUF2637 domain-containing protein [Streptosporangiales bacterium]|nr:DUF2637 domain-containing protein [Streptosporangiales bacterium]
MEQRRPRHERNALRQPSSNAVANSPGERFTRHAITTVLALIAALTFAFSFGNTWTVGLRLGVQPWIAPLVGPAVDLSVIGLLTAIHYAVTHGVDLRRLRSARLLLAFCALATLALNIAEPLARRAYGQAAFEIVAPILLLGWSEVGPVLLREIHASTLRSTGEPARSDSVNQAKPLLTPSSPTHPNGNIRPHGQGSDRRPSRSDHELLETARRIDQQHRDHHGRPISADNLRHELAIGANRARALVKVLRSKGASG